MNIDKFRHEIKTYTASLNVYLQKQVVILDEADSLPPKIQKEMKFFLENECINTTVIMTTNEVDEIIDAIRSRCIEIDYDYEFSDEHSDDLKQMMLQRVKENLATEKKEIEETNVMQVINRFFPDLRRINNNLSVHF